jgi:hypothetical protein
MTNCCCLLGLEEFLGPICLIRTGTRLERIIPADRVLLGGWFRGRGKSGPMLTTNAQPPRSPWVAALAGEPGSSDRATLQGNVWFGRGPRRWTSWDAGRQGSRSVVCGVIAHSHDDPVAPGTLCRSPIRFDGDGRIACWAENTGTVRGHPTPDGFVIPFARKILSAMAQGIPLRVPTLPTPRSVLRPSHSVGGVGSVADRDTQRRRTMDLRRVRIGSGGRVFAQSVREGLEFQRR